MLRLRPYNKNDAETIISWTDDETAFYKWTAGVLGSFPITLEQFNAVSNHMAFTATDDDEIVGFFIMRRPTKSHDVLRFGFVIVNPAIRGKGYGKKMLQLGIIFAKEIYGARKVSLGVFKNNEPAYYCYRAVGFEDLPEIDTYEINGETWACLELEMNLCDMSIFE